jgi:hypothetical protein
MTRRYCILLQSMVLLAFAFSFTIRSPSVWADGLATGTPTSFKVTVTKVEMWNGSLWVALFSGGAQLDLVTGGTFREINNLTPPEGTYSKIRITIKNSFPLMGSVTYQGVTYYTTGVDGGDPGTGSLATTAPGSQAEYTFYDPGWGNLNDEYTLPEQTISPAFTVASSTDFQPILRFTLTDMLELGRIPPPDPIYWISLALLKVTVVLP